MSIRLLRDYSYPSAFSVSLVLHALVVAFLFKAPQRAESVRVEARSPNTKPIIQAVSVDKSILREQVQRLKRERLSTKRREQQKRLAIEESARRAKQRERLANKRLQTIKQKIHSAKHKIATNQKELQNIAKHKKELQQHLKSEQNKQLKQKQLAKQRLLQQKKRFQEQAKKRMQEISAAKKHLAEQELARLKARRNASELARYKVLILQSISRGWIYPANVDKSKTCRLQVHLAADGSVLDVTIIKSSGDAILDRSAKSAVFKASPLPVPTDQDLFTKFRILNLTMRPEKVLASI